jgi:hypothetical protein
MPFHPDPLAPHARGGTELMKQALADRLHAAGRTDLFEFFDFYPTRVGQFNPHRPSIYWVHDLAGDSNTQHLTAEQHIFSAIVVVSHWQQQEFQRRYPMTKQNQAVIPNAIRSFEPVTYHGAVPNDQIRDALRQSHLFAFPSIWPETSCIALIEAMASACICVHSNLAALPETAGGMTLCYPFLPDHAAHFQLFTETLGGTLNNLLTALKQGHRPCMALLAMQRANAIYNWDTRIHE